jgi:hypothetical protein
MITTELDESGPKTVMSQMRRLKTLLTSREKSATVKSTKHDPFMVVLEQHLCFRAVCVIAIMVNTVWVGVQADLETRRRYRNIKNPDEPEDMALIVGEYIFTGWFTIEIFVRASAMRQDYLFGPDRWWNVCDVLLVLNSYFGIFIFIFLSGQDHLNLAFVRILRVFRLIRVVRVVKHVKALGNLRTLVFSILNSFVNLLWAFLVIILIVFIFSVIFQNAISTFFSKQTSTSSCLLPNSMPGEGTTELCTELNEYFGTLYRTMGALFASITGGNDWMLYAELLRMIGEEYFLLFGFYIAFATVGLLNVVTGIFVDSAVCTRTDDEVIESYTQDRKRTAETIKMIFHAADTEKEGVINLKQFKEQLSIPWVKAYFHGLDIDPEDALAIFKLIDSDCSNQVDVDEFVAGTMRLKGHSKQVDVLTMIYDNQNFHQKLNELCQYVLEEVRILRSTLQEGHRLDSRSLGHGSLTSAGYTPLRHSKN